MCIQLLRLLCIAKDKVHIEKEKDMKEKVICSEKNCNNEIDRKGYCKECTSRYNKAYYKANREKMLSHQKDYYVANREERMAYSREYWSKHKSTGSYVYVITDKADKVLYVGMTQNIERRLNFHIRGFSHIKELIESDKWKSIKYLDVSDIVNDREELKFIENELIMLYETEYNQKLNKVKEMDNLRSFIIKATLHDSRQNWQVFCYNKKSL